LRALIFLSITSQSIIRLREVMDMTEKGSGLNKTILYSVGMLAITAIVITVLLTSGGGKSGSGDPAKDLQAYFVENYGVEPVISIMLHGVSKNQAETITKQASKDFGLNDAEFVEYKGSTWYEATSEDGSVDVNAFYE
jgi:ABC-type metal ion transport system substrate-binding protein